jgi:hypothetical protein
MKRDFELRGASRRDFVKGVLTASAALGLGPTRALELLDEFGGSALAQSANLSRRSVNIVAGTGSLSWFTLLWPIPQVIKGFNSTFAYDDPAKAILAAQTAGQFEGRSLYSRAVNGKALWSSYGEKKLVSALMCGSANAHESAPSVANNTNTIPDGNGGTIGLFAGSAALQGTLKALVPAIGMKFQGTDMPYGRAPGAPSVASVVDPNAMIGLFSSAASRLTTRLLQPSNQALYGQYYKALLGLTRTANRQTFQKGYSDSRVAADLLAKNLGDLLKPLPGQVNTWCGGAAPVNEKVDFMAQALIVTANAFKLGLCAQVNFPVFNDDPHPAFANLATTSKIADQLVYIFEAFMADQALANDPVYPGKKLSDSVVITVHGDTPKDGFIASAWPDSTKGGHNVIYVMSQGRVKPGWFGDVQPTGKTNFDPLTGKLNPAMTGAAADKLVLDASLSAILYAVSDANDRAVRDFTTAANYTGMVNPLISS